jgi:hypothetical protein
MRGGSNGLACWECITVWVRLSGRGSLTDARGVELRAARRVPAAIRNAARRRREESRLCRPRHNDESGVVRARRMVTSIQVRLPSPACNNSFGVGMGLSFEYELNSISQRLLFDARLTACPPGRKP